ncbi:Dync1i1 protein, partial [Thecamonas trahens ATCC 50062]
EEHKTRREELARKADAVAGRTPVATADAASGTDGGEAKDAGAASQEKGRKGSRKARAGRGGKGEARGDGAKTKGKGKAGTGKAVASKAEPVTVDELVLSAVGDVDPSGKSRRRRKVELSMEVVAKVEADVAPDVREQYSREIQTETTLADLVQQEAAAERLTELEAAVADAEAEAAAAAAEAEAADAASKRTISLQERKAVLESENFLSFFTKASSWMNRALNEEYDIMVDYTMDYARDGGGMSLADSLTHRAVFASDRWSRHRSVTSLDWSPQFPELFLGALNSNEMDPLEPGGGVLVWSERTEEAPELVLLCESPVTAAQFSPFNPQLVVAGTYSGQVVIWDMRVQKRTPVLRTPLSSQGHTHPIYAARVVGTPNAHNLISISTDGRLCSWTLDMLAAPQEVLELTNKQLKKPVAVTALDFAAKEANAFVAGAEDGSVYAGFRHGAKQGLDDARAGHFGMVTALDVHPPGGSTDFSELFLSSSMDWSAKLWSIGSPEPIYSFEDAHDYIYDVQWSPAHPALFATGDGGGFLDIWNLNANSEVPLVKAQLPTPGASISQLRWSADGTRIIAGDSLGSVHLFDVGKEIAEPAADEWSRFEHTLSQLRRV